MKVDIFKIDKLRNERGMTTRELCDKAMIGSGTLSNIRKAGHARNSTVEQIAQALGVPAEELMPDEEEVKEAKEDVETPAEQPEAITQMLTAVKEYGEHEYQRGKNEMCSIFLKAVREAIDRWEENNAENTD